MLLAVDRAKLSEMGILGPLGLENLQGMSDAEATTGTESTCKNIAQGAVHGPDP